jgi:hypothetical protein
MLFFSSLTAYRLTRTNFCVPKIEQASKSGLRGLFQRRYASSPHQSVKSGAKRRIAKPSSKNSKAVEVGEQKDEIKAPITTDPLWIRQRRQAEEIAKYTQSLAKELAKIQSRSDYVTTSASFRRTRPRKRAKSFSRKAIRISTGTKTFIPPPPRFSIEMDPVIQSNIVDTPSDTKRVATKRKPVPLRKRAPLGTTTTDHPTTTVFSKSKPPGEPKSPLTPTKPEDGLVEPLDSLKIRRLKSVLSDIEADHARISEEEGSLENSGVAYRGVSHPKKAKTRRKRLVKRFVPSKKPTAFDIAVDKEWRRVKAKNKDYKKLSLRKILKEWKKIRKDVKAILLMRKINQRGFAIFPRRPPSQFEQKQKQWKEEQELTSAATGRPKVRPGNLPRTLSQVPNESSIDLTQMPSSLLTGTVVTRIPKQEYEGLATRFLNRTSHFWILGMLALAVLLYETLLAFDEYYYTSRPQKLGSHLDLELQTNAEFLRGALQRQKENETLAANQSRKWLSIEFGYLPNFVWRWLLRAEREKMDPLVYVLVSTWRNVQHWATSRNVSFFMNHSRFWKRHAEQVNAGRRILESLRSNGTVPPRLAHIHRNAVHQAIDSDPISIAMLKQDAIPVLLHSVHNAKQDESETDFSLESLILRTILGNKARVQGFWNLDESMIESALEALLLHTQTQPTMVGFAVASLTSVPLPKTLSEQNSRILASIISMIRKNEVRFGYVANFGAIAVSNLSGDSSRSEVSPPPSYNFEPESIRREPSIPYLLTASIVSAGYLFIRYNSNSLWNGLGQIPHRLRLIQVQKRLYPALFASLLWSFIDLSSPAAHMLIGRYTGLEPADPNKASMIPRSRNSPLLPAFLSLGYGVTEWSIKLGMLWKVPFIFAPQLLTDWLTTPFVWWRRWKHRRMQRKPKSKS